MLAAVSFLKCPSLKFASFNIDEEIKEGQGLRIIGVGQSDVPIITI